ncbi:MAG: iron-containing alcohol dehydrogenase [Thomasclavelia sp.]
MQNFDFYNPTRIIFGKNVVEQIVNYVKIYGKKVCLFYEGQGNWTIKTNGLYKKVMELIKGCDVCEVTDVEANPRIETVKKAIKVCRDNDVDVLLAIGGTSVLDCAKAVAAGYYYYGDPWDFVSEKEKIKKALPIIDIMTMAATGSHMNNMAIISNVSKGQKRGISSPLLFPKVSFLDPTYTFTIPKRQTAAGTADIMSHIMETYFNDIDGTQIQDGLAFTLLKICIKDGEKSINDPENYESRANIMWASTLAFNGILAAGGDIPWSVHMMEHVLSAVYNVIHGEGLAVLTPSWMRYILDDTTAIKFKEFGVNVWGIDSSLSDFEAANLAINELEDFFINVLHLPSKLSEIGVDDSKFDEMAEIAVKGTTINGYKSLNKEDVINIYKMCK